jgi:hypothetical protein
MAESSARIVAGLRGDTAEERAAAFALVDQLITDGAAASDGAACVGPLSEIVRRDVSDVGAADYSVRPF